METKAAYSQPLYLHLLHPPVQSRSHSVHLTRVSASRPHSTISRKSAISSFASPAKKILETVPGSPLFRRHECILDLSISEVEEANVRDSREQVRSETS